MTRRRLAIDLFQDTQQSFDEMSFDPFSSMSPVHCIAVLLLKVVSSIFKCVWLYSRR